MCTFVHDVLSDIIQLIVTCVYVCVYMVSYGRHVQCLYGIVKEKGSMVKHCEGEGCVLYLLRSSVLHKIRIQRNTICHH